MHLLRFGGTVARSLVLAVVGIIASLFVLPGLGMVAFLVCSAFGQVDALNSVIDGHRELWGVASVALAILGGLFGFAAAFVRNPSEQAEH